MAKKWVALWDDRDVNPLAWANGGPCITQDVELRAIACPSHADVEDAVDAALARIAEAHAADDVR